MLRMGDRPPGPLWTRSTLSGTGIVFGAQNILAQTNRAKKIPDEHTLPIKGAQILSRCQFCSLGMEHIDSVEAILRRLHRSARTHYERSTLAPITPVLFAGEPRRGHLLSCRRQKIKNIVRARQNEATLIQVAQRLRAFASKTKASKHGCKGSKLNRSKHEIPPCSIGTSSPGGDEEYLGDSSSLSSVTSIMSLISKINNNCDSE